MTKQKKPYNKISYAKKNTTELTCATHNGVYYYRPGVVRRKPEEVKESKKENEFDAENFAEWYAPIPERSLWLDRFINGYMLSGNRSVISKVVLNLMVDIKKNNGQMGICFIFEFLDRVRMPVFVRQRFLFRRSRLESFILPWWKQFSLSMIWLKAASRDGREDTLSQNILSEIGLYGRRDLTSGVLRRRVAVFTIIHETRLLSHFRWRYV